jgi:hypothetical protein
MVLRGMKFAHRWQDLPDLCLTEYLAWIAALPNDFHRKLTRMQSALLAADFAVCLSDREWAAEFAATLPTSGRDLVVSLLEVSG